MDIYETLSAQMDAMKVPLYAVTVTAVDKLDTPALLMMHWHGFRRATPIRIPGVEVPRRPLPGSATQIDANWETFAGLDRALLEVAWQLGAWDLERIEYRAWWRLGAPAGEALAGRRAFGDFPDSADAGQHLIADAPDREALMNLAAHKGYLRWLFRPRKGGVWAAIDDPDDTVDASGGRALPCPVPPKPRRGQGSMPTLYRLGSLARILVPNEKPPEKF